MVDKNEVVLGPSVKNEGYTVFKNTDEKMVAEIKKMQESHNNDVFSHDNHKSAKVVQTLNDKQLLCLDSKNEYFIIKPEDIQSNNKTDIIQEINNKFDIAKIIHNSLGDLYSQDGLRKLSFQVHKSEFYDGLTRMSCSEPGLELHIWDREITLKRRRKSYGSMMFCHINEEGNVVNRDYNIKLQDYINNKPKTKKELIEEIVAAIPNVPYENYASKWFAKDFAYDIYAPQWSDSMIEDDDDEVTIFHMRVAKKETYYSQAEDQYGYGRDKIKKPKKAVKSSKKEILQQILPLVNNLKWGGEPIDLSEYLSGVKEKEPVAPTKRIQQTKLKEKQYTIYDYREHEDILNNKPLMECLENISNSIDIPNNVEEAADWVADYLHQDELPSFSFNKGEKQEDHSKFKGLVKMPHGCNFTFDIEEGDACEITNSHSIYETDVVDVELVD